MKNLNEMLRKPSLSAVVLSLLGLPLGTHTRRSRLSWASLIFLAAGISIQCVNSVDDLYKLMEPLAIGLSIAGPLAIATSVVLSIVTWKERRSKEVLLLAVIMLLLASTGIFA
jgi:uncharacterized membrane protein YwaF